MLTSPKDHGGRFGVSPPQRLYFMQSRSLEGGPLSLVFEATAGRRMADVPSPALRRALMEVVRNQLRDGEPPETRATLDRLMAEGHPREQALEVILGVVSSEIVDILNQGEPFNESRFVAALRALPLLPWDED